MEQGDIARSGESVYMNAVRCLPGAAHYPPASTEGNRIVAAPRLFGKRPRSLGFNPSFVSDSPPSYARIVRIRRPNTLEKNPRLKFIHGFLNDWNQCLEILFVLSMPVRQFRFNADGGFVAG